MNGSKAARWWRHFILPALVIAVVLGTLRTAVADTIQTNASPTVVDTPRPIGPSNSNSYNWAGYVASAGSGQQFTSVLGSWTVPSVTSSKGSGNTYSSCWVGLDGSGSSTVEQIGTEADVINGTPTYYAWYEYYPSQTEQMLNMLVSPGNQMSASVTWDGYQTLPSGLSGYVYVLDLRDISTSAEISQTLFLGSDAARASAEWIAEAPTVNGQVASLANFGTVAFSGASAALGTGPETVISGLSSTALNMVAANGTTVLASTSSLNGAGNGFSVTTAPEPSTLVLLGIGAVSLLAYAWRRRTA